MEAVNIERLIERLRGELSGGRYEPAPFAVPAAAYRDPNVFERERALFAGPRIIAASSAIAPNTAVPVDLEGMSALITRSADGELRAFANACRHRGTRLTDKPCSKAIVCPYHAWTYDLAGSLMHVPHREAFSGIDLEGRGLAPYPVTERHGLVWLGHDVEHYLGDLDGDVAALDLEHHVLWNRAHATRQCNWKLVIEAFLDGYHIRTLHRDTVYRYFLDAASVAEPVGPHIRAVTGRRALTEAADVGLRNLASPSLLLFPATIVVEHPDFVSVMTAYPLAVDRIAWDHMMFVPADRAHESAHWERSWSLIEEGVFQREDLWICEQAQRSIMAGTTDELLFGSLEHPARWFHDAMAANRGHEEDADVSPARSLTTRRLR
jgi:phenylpropionate dioxygenase-like ring-hydroxylating dioxygenase large terminal subunit